MKNFPCITFLFMLLVCVTGASAQMSVDGSAQTIFDDLQTSKPGKGEVIVNQPEALRKMVGVRLYGDNVEKTDSTAFLKIQGFRTQVFPEIANVSRKMKRSKKKRRSRNFSLMSRLMSAILHRFGNCV